MFNKEQRKEYYNKNKIIWKEYYKNRLNHCVYALKINGKMYIGSCRQIDQRLVCHKEDSLRSPNTKIYAYIRENGGWDNVKVDVLIDKIPSKKERLVLEATFISMLSEEVSLNTKKGDMV